MRLLTKFIVSAIVLLTSLCGLAFAETADTGQRAAWMLERSQYNSSEIGGTGYQQMEIGGSILSEEPQTTYQHGNVVLPMLMSLILPGAGEVYTGHKRGFLLAALDIFGWTQVAKYNSDGDDLKDAYYIYADEHWSEDALVIAYNSASGNIYYGGLGLEYFPNPENATVSDVANLGDAMSLWISREDDEREYYENLGKWDQFVFGWDDFRPPSDPPAGIEYTPTHGISDFRQPWTSKHRDVYREMREFSNDAYQKRDRYLYLTIGLRIFSIFEVAYLQGLFGGNPEESHLKVAGHPVNLIAEPVGFRGAQFGARIGF